MTYLDKLPLDDRIREMRRLYRRVFSELPEGRIVFCDLLQTLGYFDPSLDPEAVALRNFACSLLRQVMGSDSHALLEGMHAVSKHLSEDA